MARCYSGPVPKRQPSRALMPLPAIWLISDARNDTALAAALARLPRGSGFIFRHYHLPPPKRRARFEALARIARAHGHAVVLAGSAKAARAWGADGSYGPAGRGNPRTRLVTAHSLRELAKARGAAAVLLSPVFATRSHPGAPVLGPLMFRALARHSRAPVIALGGMTAARARALGTPRWAAIDGLSSQEIPRILDGESPPRA